MPHLPYKLSAPLRGLLGKAELSRPAALKELYVWRAMRLFRVAKAPVKSPHCVSFVRVDGEMMCLVDRSWVYVKEHKLQDPADGRVIRPNQEMKDVFNVSSDIKFTQVVGLISKHLEKPAASA